MVLCVVVVNALPACLFIALLSNFPDHFLFQGILHCVPESERAPVNGALAPPAAGKRSSLSSLHGSAAWCGSAQTPMHFNNILAAH